MLASRYARPLRSGAFQRVAALTLGAVFALVVAGMTHASTPDTSAPDFAAIDRYVEEEMAATRLPGAALGIVHGGEIVHLKGFGDADDSGRKVTPQTPFYIGSTSKSFTALATMQLVEADKVELDAPVQRYIPWFRLADPDASARITVRDLLNQTSGIPNRNGYFWKQAGGDADALEEGVRFLRAVELDRPVGETFEYANANYTTLGLVVQMVSGKPYEQYVNDHILTPLGMKNSFMFVPEAVRHGLATEHRFWFDRPVSGGGLPYNRAITPAGLISSDAQDMSRYLIAQLNEGRYEETRILSPEGVALMHRGSADNGGGDSYAMGWVDSVGVDGERFAWHNGDTGASHAYIAVMPESDWGVVLLANGSNDLRPVSMDAIAQGVIAQLVGREPTPLPGIIEEPYSVPLLVILSAGALQVIGIARSVALLCRWRAHPARRPRGARGVGLRAVAPLVFNLLWTLVLLVVLPSLVGLPLQEIIYPPSDIGLVVVLSGAVALIWGVALRPGLTFLVLRNTGAPKESSALKAKGSRERWISSG